MSDYQIRATTQDGGDVDFECRPDEDIISAALRHDIYLMSSCREGGCATCKALCSDGDYELKGCSVQALPPDEEEEGQVLLCKCYPRSDMTLELPYTYDRISFEELGSREGTIVAVNPLSSNVVQLLIDLHPDESGRRGIQFTPGQFMELTIPGTEVARSYSPANLPNTEGKLEFLIRILPDGKFSTYLKERAKLGDLIKVQGPLGVFSAVENGLRARYFIAGGTGIAPVVSMVRRMQEWSEPQETRIYFGVTHMHEAFYADELKHLEASMGNLKVKLCVWHADDTWPFEKGNAIDVLRADLKDEPVRPDVYLCGPPGMVDAAYMVCDEFEIPKGQIYLEKFLSSEKNPVVP